MVRPVAIWLVLTPIAILQATIVPEGCAAGAGSRTDSPGAPRGPATQYRVKASEKFDALCLVNLLSDDPFYIPYYPAEHAWWREHVSAETLAAARRIKQVLKDEDGGIVSASLVLYLSVSRSTTVAGTLADLEHLDRLQRRFARTPYYDAESWSRFASIAPALATVLRGLQSARFPEHWASAIKPVLRQRAAVFGPALASRDIVPLQEKMLGFRLSDRSITVYLVHFTSPHGIKITGNRFLTAEDLPPEIVIRTAIHEMMHPPFDTRDPALWEAVEPIRAHPLVADRLAHHDPSFGYNTFEGLLEEDVVKVLDQFIAERLGVAQLAAERWRANDQGLHVIAAALYAVMREDLYDRTGGSAAAYLRDPAHVRRIVAALDRIAAIGL
jgi:hypothetical protein